MEEQIFGKNSAISLAEEKQTKEFLDANQESK